ncbi:MAG: hypothetical protein HY602_02800, partial [Parcubacteria group bacterium]|nr:hypothetical protein [Parcubacteria group bacterium]
LPYVLNLLPAGRSYAGRWWSEFSNYLILGPLLTFFLWLSLGSLDIQGIKTKVEVGKDTAPATVQEENIAKKILDEKQFYNYLLAIVMLMAGLYLSQSIAGAAAGMMGKIRGNMTKWGKDAAKGLGKGLGGGAKMAGKGIDTLAGRVGGERLQKVVRGLGIGAAVGVGAAVGGLPLMAALGAGFGVGGIGRSLETEKGKNLKSKALGFMAKLGMQEEAGRFVNWVETKAKGAGSYFGMKADSVKIKERLEQLQKQGVDKDESATIADAAIKAGNFSPDIQAHLLHASDKAKLSPLAVQSASARLSLDDWKKFRDNQIQAGNAGTFYKALGKDSFEDLVRAGKIQANQIDKDAWVKDPEMALSYLSQFSPDELPSELRRVDKHVGLGALKQSLNDKLSNLDDAKEILAKVGPSIDDKTGSFTNTGSALMGLGLADKAAIDPRDGFKDTEALAKSLGDLTAKEFANTLSNTDLPKMSVSIQKAFVDALSDEKFKSQVDKSLTREKKEEFSKVQTGLRSKNNADIQNDKYGDSNRDNRDRAMYARAKGLDLTDQVSKYESSYRERHTGTDTVAGVPLASLQPKEAARDAKLEQQANQININLGKELAKTKIEGVIDLRMPTEQINNKLGGLDFGQLFQLGGMISKNIEKQLRLAGKAQDYGELTDIKKLLKTIRQAHRVGEEEILMNAIGDVVNNTNKNIS